MENLRRATHPPSSAPYWRWAISLAVILAACTAGEAAEPIMPAPHLLAPLLAGLAAAGSGLVTDQVPARVNQACQAVLGVLMGSYLNPAALHQAAGAVLPLAAVTAATAAFSLAIAAVLARLGRMDRATATLGMIPGGSAAVVSCAKDLDADPRLVAFMQYLRVGMVATTAPMAVRWLLTSPSSSVHPAPGGPGSWHLVTGSDQDTGLFLLGAVALTGTWLARLIRLPSPALLGPMVATAILTTSSAATGLTPTGPLRSALFTIVGLDVGLHFTRSAIARMGRLLPLALACTLAVSIACAALAFLLSALIPIPLPDAYLATTPGGINAVLATAAATHADVPLISSVQSLRLFTMVLLAPLLIRLAGPRPPAPQQARRNEQPVASVSAPPATKQTQTTQATTTGKHRATRK